MRCRHPLKCIVKIHDLRQWWCSRCGSLYTASPIITEDNGGTIKKLALQLEQLKNRKTKWHSPKRSKL